MKSPSVGSLFSGVRSGEGEENQKSDARALAQQSTVLVGPSSTMLTYRLNGTTEIPVSNRAGHF